MKREFKRYRPIQVARFVKTLYSGEFTLPGMGHFEFKKGRVALPMLSDKKKFRVAKEINQQVALL